MAATVITASPARNQVVDFQVHPLALAWPQDSSPVGDWRQGGEGGVTAVNVALHATVSVPTQGRFAGIARET